MPSGSLSARSSREFAGVRLGGSFAARRPRRRVTWEVDRRKRPEPGRGHRGGQPSSSMVFPHSLRNSRCPKRRDGRVRACLPRREPAGSAVVCGRRRGARSRPRASSTEVRSRRSEAPSRRCEPVAGIKKQVDAPALAFERAGSAPIRQEMASAAHARSQPPRCDPPSATPVQAALLGDEQVGLVLSGPRAPRRDPAPPATLRSAPRTRRRGRSRGFRLRAEGCAEGCVPQAASGAGTGGAVSRRRAPLVPPNLA